MDSQRFNEVMAEQYYSIIEVSEAIDTAAHLALQGIVLKRNTKRPRLSRVIYPMSRKCGMV
jgi:hypothetical protein